MMRSHQVVKTYADKIPIFRLFAACREEFFIGKSRKTQYLFVKTGKKLSTISREFLSKLLDWQRFRLKSRAFGLKFCDLI